MATDIENIEATLPEVSVTAQPYQGKDKRVAAQLRPIWKITVNKKDISEKLRPLLVSLTITDDRANETDEVELVISDRTSGVPLPEIGSAVTVAIGWRADPVAAPYRRLDSKETGFPVGLIDKGSYTIQAVEHSGAPDLITVRARAANMIDSLRTLRNQSWHKTTVGAIVASIAKRNSLPTSVDKEVAVRKVKHADQITESDASFLRRMADTYDCICTVKNGTLLFSQARAARTPSGKTLEPVTITRAHGDQHRWSRQDRDAYSGVRAWFNNVKTGQRSAVVAGISGRAKDLRITFASRADALAAARAEWLRIQRGIFSFEINLAFGRADLTPQRPAVVCGFKDEIDDTAWIITSARHTLSESGYTTSLTLETEQQEGVEGQEETEDD